MKPQDIVALMLACAILVFFAGGILRVVLSSGETHSGIIDMWSDVVKVTLGGLIGYMSAKKDN